jgi:hypothetical protein
MNFKQKLFSNMFVRNMLADFGERSAYSKTPGDFTAYFQYKVEPYQQDYYLYFPKEPFALRYKNEIFNKLFEYNGYDIIQYLEFHFDAFPDKTDFLHFLQYEIGERLKGKPRSSHLLKLQSAMDWVKEKLLEIKSEQDNIIRQHIEQDVRSIMGNQPSLSLEQTDDLIKSLTEKLSGSFEKMVDDTEKRMEALTDSYVTGNIELNNHNHLEKVIQLFVLLQSVQAPVNVSRGEQLFKRFSGTDLASILHLHFLPFRDKKINTLQVKIREATERLNNNNPKVKNLNTALQQFFY